MHAFSPLFSIAAALFVSAQSVAGTESVNSLSISTPNVRTAAETNSSLTAASTKQNTSFEKISNPENQKKINLDVSLLGIQYLSVSPADTAFQQKAQVELGYHNTIQSFDLAVSALAGSFSLPRSSYVALPEAYIGVSSENHKNYFALGRKIQNFSFMDRQLNLGLYDPYFSNDFIEYKEQGLVGVHTGLQTSIFGLTAGYYPYYLPNQGPQVYAESGEIRTSNRWAQKPPDQLQFGSQNRAIVYAIRDYDLKDIVSNSGYALSTFLGHSDDRPWIKASYSRKPISEIPLSRDTYGTAVNFSGQVKLSPVVTYSQTKSLDLNLDNSLFKTTFSYLEDQPENTVAVDKETLQILEPLKIYGAWFSVDLSNWLGRAVISEVSYSEIYGGKISDLLADGRPSLFTFSTQRTLFKKPLSFKVQTKLFSILNRPLVTSVKWTYDEFYKGSLLSGLVKYQALTKMNLNMGFDLLGVEDETANGDHFLKSNQANSRVYGGLDYAF